MDATRPHWWLVSIGSGNGLVLSGINSLPGLTSTWVLWWRMETPAHNELIKTTGCRWAWVSVSLNPLWPIDTHNCQLTWSSLVYVIACSLCCTKPYLNQWWLIINYTLSNKLQRNLNQTKKTLFQENPFENIICKMAANFSWHQHVMLLHHNRNISLAFPWDIIG